MQEQIVQSACVYRSDEDHDPRGSTPKTHQLVMDVINLYNGEFYEFRGMVNGYAMDSDKSLLVNEAERWAYVMTHMTPWIRRGEIIVGARRRLDSPMVDQDGLLSFATESPKRYETGSVLGLNLHRVPPGRDDILNEMKRGMYITAGLFNHKTVHYGWFIGKGSETIIEEAQALYQHGDAAARDVANAYITGNRAMMEFAEIYAKEAERLAAMEESKERKKELTEIAAVCRRVPAKPAETFREALQSLWFAYMCSADSIGHPDQFLLPYYQRDKEAGILTDEQAQELMECFLIKVHADFCDFYCNVSSYQTITLGGMLEDGSDACNALTRIMLRAIDSVKLLRPSVYVRCNDNTPEDILQMGVHMAAKGLGNPVFYGDYAAIRGLTRLGIDKKIAYNYCLGGCAEMVPGDGSGNWMSPSGWINIALIVDDALREHAEQSAAFDEQAVWNIIDRRARIAAKDCCETHYYVDTHCPYAFFEAMMMMPLCLKNGRGIYDGGLDTYMAQWEGCGLTNGGDMLTAASQLCKSGITLRELFSKLDAGDELLSARIRHLPHFGSGERQADENTAKLLAMVANAVESYTTDIRPISSLGYLNGAENMHIEWGMMMGPTLDGRKAGEPLGDSLCGSQGMARKGPTALIQSLTALDFGYLPAGTVATVCLDRSYASSQEKLNNIVALLRSYVHMGGGQMQFNFIDVETLRDAQKNPLHHEGLLVRVAGYCADFTQIDTTTQDEIISRWETIQ